MAALYPSETSKYMEEGTIAHATVEAVMLGLPLPDKCNADMIEHAYEFKRYDTEYLGRAYEVLASGVETKVRLGFLNATEDHEGGVDRWAMVCNEDHYALYVCDFKYGQGVRVHAKNNVQMMLYAKALIDYRGYVVNCIVLRIYQPRLPGGISTWTISVAELEDRIAGLVEAAKRTGATTTHIEFLEATPGEHCGFCSGKKSCKRLRERLRYFMERIENVNGDQALVEALVHELTEDELLATLEEWRVAQILGKAVEREIEKRVIYGTGVKGYRKELCQDGRNTITDRAAVVKVLEEAQATTSGFPIGLTYTTTLAPGELMKQLKGHTSVIQKIQLYIKKPEPSVKAVRVYECDNPVGSYDPSDDMPVADLLS